MEIWLLAGHPAAEEIITSYLKGAGEGQAQNIVRNPVLKDLDSEE